MFDQIERGMAMIYGYARVSTKGQSKDGNSLAHQQQELTQNGAQVIFTDVYTGTKINRPQLEQLLQQLKAGDVVMVTKLDRFARSANEGIQLVDRLLSQGVKVHILNMGVLDDTPTGVLIRNIMLCFAQFERDMIVQRTQEGKEIARRHPGYREGRKPLYSKHQINHALELLEHHSYRQVTEMTGISKSTLIRAKRARSG